MIFLNSSFGSFCESDSESVKSNALELGTDAKSGNDLFPFFTNYFGFNFKDRFHVATVSLANLQFY